MDVAGHVGVTNPIASDQTLLRASLLPAIRKNILDNSRHFQSFRLFEIGREIHARNRELPKEDPALRRGDLRSRGRRQRVAVRVETPGRMSDGRLRRRVCRPRGRSSIPSAPRLSCGMAKTWGACLSCIRRWCPRAAPRFWIWIWRRWRSSASEERAIRRCGGFPTSTFDLSVEAPASREPAAICRTGACQGRGQRSGRNQIRPRATPAPPLPGGSQERVLPACGGRAGPHAIVRGSGGHSTSV